MCKSNEEKVFRKEGEKTSKRKENFFMFCFLAFVISLIVLIITSIILLIQGDPLWYAFTTVTCKINQCCSALTPILFFLSLVDSCVCTLTSYTLTLDENTLVYKDDSKSVALQLPCSHEKRRTQMKLRNDDTEITLDYTEPEEAELLEFLKDIIN